MLSPMRFFVVYAPNPCPALSIPRSVYTDFLGGSLEGTHWNAARFCELLGRPGPVPELFLEEITSLGNIGTALCIAIRRQQVHSRQGAFSLPLKSAVLVDGEGKRIAKPA